MRQLSWRCRQGDGPDAGADLLDLTSLDATGQPVARLVRLLAVVRAQPRRRSQRRGALGQPGFVRTWTLPPLQGARLRRTAAPSAAW
ncbi:MAG: hypothetical protein IPO15_14790 [Anaerolineae bacterium]|uniref:hypothetical protein n=1 Tax=Candidatus Amarolinea dominans TaxID=3140696 RepID=UPI0031363B8E|nr:hypothetical protein [Anaerolineae bacterium]